MMQEIVMVDKPAGWTSFDVVAKVRGGIRAQYGRMGKKPTKRQLKVGHSGTLDPFATGLLVLLVGGDATKRAGEFLKLDKTYEATIKLGEVSTTGDPEGELSDVSTYRPTTADVTAVLDRFTGSISQTPPLYSAIKLNGQRAYDLARKGKTVAMPTRTVTVYSLELVAYGYPYLSIRAHVSSGTYIRTLAEDIGRVLGTGAYCYSLRRTKIGDMDIDQALSIDQVLEHIQLNDGQNQHDQEEYSGE